MGKLTLCDVSCKVYSRAQKSGYCSRFEFRVWVLDRYGSYVSLTFEYSHFVGITFQYGHYVPLYSSIMIISYCVSIQYYLRIQRLSFVRIQRPFIRNGITRERKIVYEFLRCQCRGETLCFNLVAKRKSKKIYRTLQSALKSGLKLENSREESHFVFFPNINK